jgi:DUF4097 and DUF4098 domain-containing protein YvlB
MMAILALILVGWPATAAARPEKDPRAAWLLHYNEARQGPEVVDKVSQTVRVGGNGSLDLSGISGDVRVTGGGGNDIVIEATKRVRHRDADEAKRLLNEVRVEISHTGNRVEVRTVYPRRFSGPRDGGWSASVDYVVTVPSGTQVSLRTVSGDITVASVRGEARVEAVSGDIRVTETPNLAYARTVSGDVSAANVSSGATLTLGTVSGTVIATGLKVRSLECGSVSGDLRVSGSQVERLEAKTVSGDVDFEAPLARNGRYSFSSHSGDLRIAVAGGAGFELDAETFSGSVRSDLPVTVRAGEPDERRGRRGSATRSLRATFGDGGAVVIVRSFSGSVVILKR